MCWVIGWETIVSSVQKVKSIQVGYYGIVGSPLNDQFEWFGLLPRRKYSLIYFTKLVCFKVVV